MKTKRKATKVKAAVKRPKNVAKAATGACFCMPALELLITGSTMWWPRSPIAARQTSLPEIREDVSQCADDV